MTTTYVQFKERIYDCSECKTAHSDKEQEFYEHRIHSTSGPGEMIYEEVRQSDNT